MRRLVEPIVADEADFVVGSRRMGEDESEGGASKTRDAGITVYTRLINLLGGTEVSDIANGYRAIRASRLAEIAFTEDQFHNPELLLGAARAGLRVVDVPVTIRRRSAGSSKKGTNLRYGLGLPAGDAQDVAPLTTKELADVRLVVVSNTPLPYHTPILNRLSERVDLHVIYMARDHPLGEGDPSTGAYSDRWGEPPRFPYSFHWSWAIRSQRSDFRAQVSFGVSARLEALRADVILFSSWGPLMLEPLTWRLLRGRRAVMWAESTAWSGLLRGSRSTAARRALLHRVDAFVANGTEAAAYLGMMGVESDRITISCLPSPLRPTDDGLDGSRGARHFLFVGRLIDRKRPLAVVAAFNRLLTQVPDATLTIVGDGPLMTAVRAAAAPAGDAVRLAGRLEGTSLNPKYAAADVLVVPSVREVWGLVVNEALAHGAFVIATDQVASARDLLDPQAGAIVPADDEVALHAAMLEAAQTLDGDRAARHRRRERVRDCTPDRFADAVAIAVGQTLQLSR